MNNTDMLTNLTALGILVFTVLVNMCIQLGTGVLDFELFPEIIFALVLLFFMFATIVCSALAVPAIKKRVESKYQKLAKQMEGEQQQHLHLLRVEEVRLSITKHLVMAASCSPQFLMTRLVSFVFMTIICLFSVVILLLAIGRGGPKHWACHKQSDYKWSLDLIVYFQQFVGINFGPITTTFLICVAAEKYEDNRIKISREEFTVEPYWIENLVEWRQSPIPIRFKRDKVMKLLHNIKSLSLTFCILLQTLFVIFIKFSCVVSFYIWLPLAILVSHLWKLLFPVHEVSNDQRRREEIDLNHFVILLEGEKQLPKRLLRKIIRGMNSHVKGGKKQQPHNLLNLLKQSFFYRGAIEFDSPRVLSLLSEEPPNCWTLPVMTLTSIVVALPNIANQHVDELVSSVDEGLQYASHIDVLNENHVLKNAASVVWVGVKLHKKWLDMDLGDKIGEVRSTKEIIQVLADKAERIIKEFSSTGSKNLLENPFYWPANVLAANSMYRISRTILLYYENCECPSEELFSKLICMISNILAVCLTNLPHLIATKCINNAFEERFRNVCDAAILFGETEDILKFFEEKQLLGIGPSQPLCIDEWRRWMETQDPSHPTVSTSATGNVTSSTVESNEVMIVQM